MSLIYCDRCDAIVDSDEVEIIEDPKDHRKLICASHIWEEEEKPLGDDGGD